jgi:hypothetical protein
MQQEKALCFNKSFLDIQEYSSRRHVFVKFKVTWSVSLIHWSVMLWRAQEPNWLALSRPLSPMCLWNICRKNVSNSLPVVGKKLIGSKLWGNFWSLLGFGNVIIFAFFQDSGKWDSWWQSLNKCVRYTSGLLGRCLRHSFAYHQVHKPFSI